MYTKFRGGMIMWIRTYEKTYSGVSKQDIWQAWVDIENWPKWHGDLEFCKLNGAFAVGNYFILKPKKMRAVKILLTEVNPGHSFTDCTSFPGAKMYDTHLVEETANGVKMINKMVVTGPLKWLWIKLVAKYVADSIPSEVDALVAMVKQNDTINI